MDHAEKNLCSSENKNSDNSYITYVNKGGNGIRVMFVGNSITRHEAAPDIGWNHNWGMAASDIEKDYVHLMISEIRNDNPDAVFCICQAVEWERHYKDGEAALTPFSEARDFEADVIIMRIIENCPWEDFDPDVFRSEYKRFIDYLNKGQNAEMILTTGFWTHSGDSEIIKAAEERNYPLVKLGEIGNDESMRAIGLFEHEGVANHPGDKGMAAIANAILAEFVKL